MMLCNYVVGFWYYNPRASKAQRRAFLRALADDIAAGNA